ncbi:MAG: hypothetical protein QNJ35_09770 [Paracoccaceae bacterium]|nr:hypothetical protein [Paracoccaceae bacterium]
MSSHIGVGDASEFQTWKPKDDLPDLEPAEDRLRRTKGRIFSADAISLTHGSAIEDVFEPKERAEHHSLTARMTVYVMNMIVIAVTLPVGLALLFFNILFGANLRTTAHIIALAGLGAALAQTQQGAFLTGLY